MSEEGNNKKYYWLKLDRGFFKRHDIRIIQSMENGKDYILFYLKLLVESIDHEGSLRFNETVPYNAKMLSVITDTNIDTVQKAIEIFTELGMMQTLDDGTIFMQETQKMLGQSYVDEERAREKNRERQKRYYDRQKALKQAEKVENDEPNTQPNVRITSQPNTELDIEIQQDKEKYKEHRLVYGAKRNIYLSKEEYDDLEAKLGDRLERELDYYSEKKAEKGYDYGNDYKGMLQFNKRVIEANEAKRKAQKEADKDDLMMQGRTFVPEWE